MVGYVLLAPTSELVSSLKQRSGNRNFAKEQLRFATAHNQKLGYNWSNVTG